MRFIVHTARKDVMRALRDPVALMTWIAMPFILTGLMAVVFGPGNPTPQGRLLVDDRDGTLVSGFLRNAFSREPLSKMVLVESVDYDAGRKRLDAGDASALLVIPKGFGDAFLRSQPVAVTLWTNPSQRILPGIIKEALSLMLEGGFYVQTLLGADLAKFAGGSTSELEVARSSVEIMRLGRQLSKAMNPPLIELQINVVEKRETSQAPMAVLFFPGMLMFAIFGLAQSMSEDIWRERSLGTLRRALTTSHTAGAFLCGKAVALGVLFASLAAAGIMAGRFALSAPIDNAPLAIIWIALAGIGLYLMAALLQVFSSEQRAGVILNGFVLFVLSMLGGTFFPFEAMPKWLAAIGQYTPNGWAVMQFKEIISGGLGVAELAGRFGILCAFILIAFALFARRVRAWAI
jgi:ABC-type multidrug transport system permease subunit